MKTKSIIVGMMALLACASCVDQRTEYERIPETINVGQLTDVVLLPGFGRFVVTGSTKYLTTAKTLKVAILDSDRVETVAVDRTQPELEYSVAGLEAGNYYVVITSYDKDGNQSLSQTYNVDVYDAASASRYYPKRITSVAYNESSEAMEFTFNAVEEAASVIFSYTRSNGETVEEELPGNVTKHSVTDWADQSRVSVTTKVLPYTLAVDLLSLEPVTADIPRVVISLPSSTFAEVNMASDAAQGQYGGPTRQLWDGNWMWSNQGYHSNDGVGVPHHITFDMGTDTKLYSATLYFRYYGDFQDWPPRKFQIWGHPAVSEEGKSISDYDVFDNPTKDNAEFVSESEAAGWVLLKEYSPTEQELNGDKKVDVLIDSDKVIRYFRYRIVEGWKAPHTGAGMYGNCTEMEFKTVKGAVASAE